MFGRLTLGAYELTGRLAGPFAGALLLARMRRGKEEPGRRRERLGWPGAARPAGPLVWVHAASVGETASVAPLIEHIDRLGPAVLLTTGTQASARLARARLPQAIHQYAPLDFPRIVARFLDHWRPDLAVFVESEVWPATIAALSRRRIPLAIVNGRMSERSFRRWRRQRAFAATLFDRVALCLAQSELDGDRFNDLGARVVRVTGNMKYDVPELGADEAALAELRAAVRDRPAWVAASTHEGEEEAAGLVHRALSKHVTGLITFIVPRHPERGEGIAEELSRLGLKVARRSIGEPLTADTDVYLGDTLGELGLFFRIAAAAFIGGSLVPVGGHNPIEPAKLRTVILHGPHVEKSREIYAALDASGGAIGIEDPPGLARALARVLIDEGEAERRREAALESVAGFTGALDRTLSELSTFLSPLAVEARLRRDA